MKRASHRRRQLVDMVGDAGLVAAVRAKVVVRATARGRRGGEIAGRLDVVAEGLERPDDDVAMAAAGADLRIGLQHEPLRPVAARLVLLGEDDAQDVAHRRRRARSVSRNSTGPWQTSRVPQAAPVYCSSPCGTVRWIIASWASQGRTMSMRRRGPGRRRRGVSAARHMAPEASGGREHRLVGDTVGEARRPRRCAFGAIRHRAGRRRRRGPSRAVSGGRHRGRRGSTPSAWSKLVAADRLDGVGRRRDEVIGGVRIGAGPRANPDLGAAMARLAAASISMRAARPRIRARRARGGRRPGSGRAAPRRRPANASPARRRRRSRER